MNKNDGFNSEHDRDEYPQQMSKRNELSAEDLLIMKECSRESFWYRCVPFGIALIGTTQYLTNRGVLKPHPKYGALLKNFAAGLVGFVLGKVSYLGTCQQKFIRNENSTFGQSLRRAKSGGASNEMMNQDEDLHREISEGQTSKPKDMSSYDQLRAQNRNNFDSKSADRRSISLDTPSKFSNVSEPSKLRIPGKKNKYGDEISKDD